MAGYTVSIPISFGVNWTLDFYNINLDNCKYYNGCEVSHRNNVLRIGRTRIECPKPTMQQLMEINEIANSNGNYKEMAASKVFSCCTIGEFYLSAYRFYTPKEVFPISKLSVNQIIRVFTRIPDVVTFIEHEDERIIFRFGNSTAYYTKMTGHIEFRNENKLYDTQFTINHRNIMPYCRIMHNLIEEQRLHENG